MPKVTLTESLKLEYDNLFNMCDIRPERAKAVDRIVAKLVTGKPRYEAVSSKNGVPWFFIAVVHNMESSLNFARHLHNGDPLNARTVQVPAGRPKTGNPPFTWEGSAQDALSLRSLSGKTDWSLAGTLYQMEGYNGWGYRLYHAHVHSPYLWSGSNHYTSGKYIADGTWSDTEASKQNGAAVLLRRLAERGQMEFPDQPAPAPTDAPLVVDYSTRRSSDPAIRRRTEDLQRWLNTFPGIFIKADGVPGPGTSEAYKKVVGSFLNGDPRK